MSTGGNTGHGHVWERPDGVKQRCGGPKMCMECGNDYVVYTEEQFKLKKETETMQMETTLQNWKQVGHILQMQRVVHLAMLRGANWTVVALDAGDDCFVRVNWKREKTHNIARLQAELWLEEHGNV